VSEPELSQYSGSLKSKEEARKDGPSAEVRNWLEIIDLASKEEEKWRKDAQEAEETFSGKENAKGTDFNIYFANQQTLVPALYNSTPIPDVRRRFGDDDPVGKSMAEILERALSYSIDQYDFDCTVESAIFDMAGPGRGIARVSYYADTGMVGGVEDVVDQRVDCEYVPWDLFRRGPAKKWRDVPWIAYLHHYTYEALVELAGKDIADKVKLDSAYTADSSKEKEPGAVPSIFKTAKCWEIWDKADRKVKFLAPSYKEGFIKVVDDPLGLEDFFDVPEPMYAVKRGGKLIPVCEYTIYKSLLNELDTVTKRIVRLVEQMRPRALGAFNQVSDIKGLAEADDGEIVQVTDSAQFLDQGGLEKMISWFPLEPVTKALAELSARREMIKQNIYEVTGMADIMRGQTDPNETLGAQQIKAKWGALRIQKRQKEIQRWIRDLLELKAEIIASKFRPELLGAMLGLEIAPEVAQALQNDGIRNCKVDIETDSTIQDTLSNDLEVMANFVQTSGSYFQGMAGAIQLGLMTPPAVTQIYMSMCRNFKLGKQATDALDQLVQVQMQQMQAQQEQLAREGPPPDPAEREFELKKAETEMKLQAEQQKIALEAQKHEQEMGFRAQEQEQKLQLEQQKMQQQAMAQEQQMAMEQQRMGMEMQGAQADRNLQIKMKRADVFAQGLMKPRKKGKGMEEEDILPIDDMLNGLSGLGQSLQQMADQMMQMQQMQMQMMQQLMSGVQQLTEIAAAPSEVVYDEAGRPVQGRKVLPGQGMLN
jgi:hypothetical protein